MDIIEHIITAIAKSSASGIAPKELTRGRLTNILKEAQTTINIEKTSADIEHRETNAPNIVKFYTTNQVRDLCSDAFIDGALWNLNDKVLTVKDIPCGKWVDEHVK